MEMSIYFLTFIVYTTYGIVAGSDYESVSKTIISFEDFPYIIYDTKDSWQDISTKLANLNDVDLKKLLGEHEKLFESDAMTNILRTLIIQHCFDYHLKNEFASEEVKLLKKAIKYELNKSKIRVESKIPYSEDETSTDSMENTLNRIRSLNSKDGNDKMVIKILDKAEYIIRMNVRKYIIIGLVPSQVANFLTELFILMDNGQPNDPNFFINSIVTKDQANQFQMQKRVVKPGTVDEVNLMEEFKGINGTVDAYLSMAEIIPQQIAFQNLLIWIHCKQRKMIDELPEEQRNILNKALEYKLKNFATRLETFLARVFYYKKVDCNKHVTPVSLADLDSDKAFARLRQGERNVYSELSEYNIKNMDNILSLWITEKILISVVNRELYEPLSIIFYYIDVKSNFLQEKIVNQKVNAILNIDLQEVEKKRV